MIITYMYNYNNIPDKELVSTGEKELQFNFKKDSTLFLKLGNCLQQIFPQWSKHGQKSHEKMV